MEKSKVIHKNKKGNVDSYKKPSPNSSHVGPEEFEETRSDKIRMKPQPFNKSDKK